MRHSEVACRVAGGSGVRAGALETSQGLGLPLQVRQQPCWGCGNRLWKVGWKDLAVIRTGADGRWDKSVSWEGGKRLPSAGCILKAELAEFPGHRVSEKEASKTTLGF